MTTNRINWLHAAGAGSSARAGSALVPDRAGTLNALKQDAGRLGCNFSMSPSLAVRGGGSLKGVFVIVTGDAHPSFAMLTGRHFNAGGLLGSGDRVLVEVAAGDWQALQRVCGGVPLPGMFRNCGSYGIAHPQIFGMTVHLRRKAKEAADWSLKQGAIVELNSYVGSSETIRARSAHMRNRVMQHHRPDRATYLLVHAALSPELVAWAMNPINRLDAAVVGSQSDR